MSSVCAIGGTHREFHRASALGIIALILLLAFTGCQGKKPDATQAESAAAERVAAPVSVTVASVQMRPVQRRVSVVGSLHGFERITITPKVEGRVQTLYFDVGDRVSPGKTLLELDSTDYQLSVEEARQSLNQELSRLDLTQPPSDEFDVEQLPAVESARLLLANAQQKFERQKTLLSQNASSDRPMSRPKRI